MMTFAPDVQNAARSLFRSPVLAMAAVLSLGLGIGASTAVFSLVHAVVLRAVPVKDIDSLVGLFTTDEKNAVPVLGSHLPISWPNLEDVGRDTPSLSAVAAYTFPFGVAMARGAGPAEQVAVELVSGNYFDVLAVRAAIGRTFTPDEDRQDGDAPVAVVSDRAFRRRFGADPSIVGQSLRINGHVFTLVGVAPKGFDGVNAFVGPDLWVPRRMHRQVLPSEFQGWLDSRRALFLNGIGRLRAGASPAALEGELDRLATTLERTYPQDNAGRGLAAIPLRETAILPGVRDLVVMGGTLLMTVVSLVLLVACANVANILLARATGRRGEIAIRAALGADRRRLLRLLLAEALLVALAGGAIGLLVAQVGVGWLWQLRPPGLIGQNFVDLTINGPVLLYAAGATLGATVLFGLAPVVGGSRADLSTLLNEAGRSRGMGRSSLRRFHVLVATQVAASLVILAAAAMLVSSLRSAQRIDPGFDVDHVAVVQISTEQAAFDSTRARSVYRDVPERVRSLPSVASVAWSQLIPLYGNGVSRTVQAWEAGGDPAGGIVATSNVVSESFLATLGIPLVAGREFSTTDRDDTQPVVMINDVLAGRLWPGHTALGRQLRLFGSDVAYEVVGVARASRYTSLGEAPQPAVFRPLAQEHVATMTLVVRGTGHPVAALGLVLTTLREAEPDVPVPFSGVMRDVLNRSLWATQLGARVLAVLGAIAVALAGLGVFGVAHHASTQRQFEVALRVAVGATPRAAGRTAVGKTMRAVGYGLVSGALLAVGLIAASRSLLYDVGWAPLTGIAIVGAGLLGIAGLATAWPARMAARVDPVRLLR